MTYFLLLTAVTVSIDSFVCGFSLSMSGGKKLTIILGISLTVYTMCAIANYSTALFAGVINERSASLGGALLVAVGVFNLFKKEENGLNPKNQSALNRAVITGFAVGLDGSLANLSLSLMGINQFYVPLVIAAMHGLMITLGSLLAETPVAKKFAKIGFLPPLILILLGGYKMLGFFI